MYLGHISPGYCEACSLKNVSWVLLASISNERKIDFLSHFNFVYYFFLEQKVSLPSNIVLKKCNLFTTNKILLCCEIFGSVTYITIHHIVSRKYFSLEFLKQIVQNFKKILKKPMGK